MRFHKIINEGGHIDFFEVVKKRASIRDYSGKSIKKHELEMIIDAGRLAPTARGEEPWDFIVVQDKNMLQKLAQIAPNGKFLETASAAIVVVAKDTKYYLEDSCAATENMLLAACALGIGSCWVAGDKKPYANQIMEYFVVPAGHKLVSIISLGYPKGDSLPHSKRPLHDVLHSEKF